MTPADDLESCWAIIRPPLPPAPPAELPRLAPQPPAVEGPVEPDDDTAEVEDLDYDGLVAVLHEPCEHVIDPALAAITREAHGGTLVVFVSCPQCGAGGRLVVEPGSVDWSTDDRSRPRWAAATNPHHHGAL